MSRRILGSLLLIGLLLGGCGRYGPPTRADRRPPAAEPPAALEPVPPAPAEGEEADEDEEEEAQ